ncbi:MAG: hypothetical protein QNK37_08385 [Acidobacteriota bacterium]|nr:hypothetical protein [Acidobacteriota bacterium]
MSLSSDLRGLNRGIGPAVLRAHIRLALACTILFGIVVLGGTIAGFLADHLLGGAPEQELRVGLKKKDVAIIRMAEPGAKTSVAAADMDTMRALPGVTDVFPVIYGTEPSHISINFMGQGFSSGMVVQGFEPDWISDEVDRELLTWQPGTPLPIIVNTQILAIYNNAYSKSRGLPELSPKALEAPIISFTYGKEPQKEGDTPPRKLFAKIVGMSSRVALGAAVPAGALKKMHTDLGKAAPDPLEAILRVSADADTDLIRAEVEAMGYTIREAHPLARLLRQVEVVARTAGLVLLACMLLFTLALLDVIVKNLQLLKTENCARMLSRGARPGRLRLLLALDLALPFTADLILGALLGYVVTARLTDLWLSPLLVELTGIPITPVFPVKAALLLALGLMLAAMGALIPRLRFHLTE